MSILYKTLVISLSFFISMAGSPNNAGARETKPKLNVLLITVDTLRADRLSCYNPEFVQTPNIDALAATGVLFKNAFAHNPLTLPSHANILLGTLPPFHGVHTNTNFLVEGKHTTLAEHLKSSGYTTAAFVAGFTLDSRFGLDQGFDVYDDTFDVQGLPKSGWAERKGEQVAQAALSWMESQDSPWFVWLHLFDPHSPYDPPPPFRQTYAEERYDGEVAYTDYALGSVFDFLRKNRLNQNTIVILTSDHGESLGEHGEQTHGFFAYNATLRVPLIISTPGTESGFRQDTVAHIDIFPSICDLIGAKKPEFLQGMSLLPVMQGNHLPEREIYFESLDAYYNEGWAPLRGFISEQMKFIESPIPELYDLGIDNAEEVNLASRNSIESYKQNLVSLLARLSSSGQVTAPAKLNTEMQAKLRSLGYVSGPLLPPRDKFGPEDDLKTKMPILNAVLDAYHLKDTGTSAECIAALEGICSRPNTLPSAFYVLAKVYSEAGKIEKSLETLQAGMKLFPQHFDLLIEYVEALLARGDYQTVITSLTSKDLSQMEQSALLYNNLGVAYTKIQQPDKALESFRKAADIDNGYAEIFQNTGRIHLARFLAARDPEEFKKAEENFSTVLSLAPNNGEAHNNLGALFFGKGEIDKAIGSWEKAIQLSDEMKMTYYYLGLAYLSKNAKERALFYLTAYKNKYYQQLAEQEKERLEKLLVLCR